MTTSLHVIQGLQNASAGPSYSVPRLVRALNENGSRAEMVSLGLPDESAEHWDHRVASSRSAPGRAIGASRAMRSTIGASDCKVLHTHGLWRMANVYPTDPWVRARRPVVLSPRGMLGREALAFSPFSKAVFRKFAQDRALARVTCFHATSEAERMDIRAFGWDQPVAVIPNGIDLPDEDALEAEDPSDPYVLWVGRIHPKKGLDCLIRAWALLEPECPRLRLKLAGPDEGGHAAELKALAGELGLSRVVFLPPVHGTGKLTLMSRAALFAMPSLHENFGMTVAESLAARTPVVATKGTPWAGLETEGCGWWVDRTTQALAEAIRRAIFLSAADRKEMGARGRAWMARGFGWEGVARDMCAVYRWLEEGGAPPASVCLD